MKNKNIIITGSEGLIGRSFVKFIQNECKNIFCLDVKNINRKNYFKCDITNEIEVKNTIEKITNKNKIDVLINNAAANPIAKKKMKSFEFINYDVHEWKRNLEVDLIGSFLISKHVLKNFQKYNQGKIINISSIYGLVGPDQNIYSKTKKKYTGYKNLEYSVAKAGLIGFTKALASYYKGTNINSLCLIFGGVENNQPLFFKNNYNAKSISNRMAKKDEYNEYLKFYCSEKASYSSGSCIVIDGGITSLV